MPRWLLASVAAVVLGTACGAVPGQGPSSALPLPSPATGALAVWNDFPANASPRPIISFGDIVEYIPQAGFPDGDRKIVFRAEVPVQGRLGDARLGDDPVDTNRLQSVALEQPVRGLEDAFASALGAWSLPLLFDVHPAEKAITLQTCL